ncbi:hypothetical protein FUAX_04550 [Fulvitalea axinellae]|uniref:F5/8 type C domain-containing protein n=1 Tax=Fulvitalea axinellae TaxID=1182444 RepID=A0AAU9CDZ7_9BACT|nr:hypothetical protein FUAX_04550 [Fulvitalea axinellae]
MKKTFLTLWALVAFAGAVSAQTKSGKELPKDYPIVPVPFNEVRLQDDFWLPRLKTQAKTLVPFALGKTEKAVENLRRAGDYLHGVKGEMPFPHRFISSDLYKVMEGAAYILMVEEDPALEERLDKIIDVIGRAQKEDGYLYVAHATGVSKHYRDKWGGGGMGDKPYSFVLHSHELYNIGHMYEAAVAYYQATGKRKFLDIAEKSAQHVNRVFFEGEKGYNGGKPVNQAPGHQEIELGLVKLYRATGNKLYLEMSRKFLDVRGITYKPDGERVMSGSYAQQHAPVADQSEAVGHAVRAAYMYAAMADNMALHEDDAFMGALDRIWHDIADTRMHITGGLGAVHGIEGFGPQYVLPNKSAYNETCAAVANVFFNFRMFLLTKDAKYMDVAEVSLYNNALAGVNMDGNRFFYVNPLEATGDKHFNQGSAGRSPWFGTACCPSNIARLMPQVSGYMYSHTDDEIYVSLYAANETTVELKKTAVKLRQETRYPFGGQVNITVTPETKSKKKRTFAMKFRLPTWARGERFVPGELYSYVNDGAGEWSLKVNGKKVESGIENGFVTVRRAWKAGDKVTFELPMEARYTKAIEKVEADRDRLAVTRGPLVYCAEGADNEKAVQAYAFGKRPDKGAKKSETINEGPLRNVERITVPARQISADGVTASELNMVPYYAWNNRGKGSMIVWVPNKDEVAMRFVGKNPEKGIKTIKASYTHSHDAVYAAIDGKIGEKSSDESISRWTSWNKKGQKQWLELELEKSREIRSVGVFWFDDAKGVRLPAEWSVEYRVNGEWKPFKLYVTDAYNLFKDQYNIVHPANRLKCDAIRINMTPRKDSAVGVLEVDIDYEEKEL